MKGGALVVISHLDPTSFNHALAAAIARTLERMDAAVSSIDLHAIDFDPLLTSAEARGVAATDPLVVNQIELLRDIKLLVVVHPICWGSPPAMMKGWMDRVFAPGAAYAFAKGGDDGEAPVGLHQGKRALVINTSNTSAERERESFGDPLERIWRDCLLMYCGFERVERQVYRVVATSTDVERSGWLANASSRAALLLRAPARVGRPSSKR